MFEDNKALIRQYLAALSGKDKPESIVNIYVSDEKLRQHIKQFESAFPRYKLTLDDMIAEGNKVAVRATWHGIHKGEFMGIQPTSKQVALTGILIYRIVNGRIVDHWMSFDNLELMRQFGVIPDD
ncbi:ester cyclase [candidate division KSB1 bacterium]|nr:ester cyclase [candidate division KSB1 bacterium]RQW02049.1 MAG: ester cyclase [candidate division KSB1 bacterium]